MSGALAICGCRLPWFWDHYAGDLATLEPPELRLKRTGEAECVEPAKIGTMLERLP